MPFKLAQAFVEIAADTRRFDLAMAGIGRSLAGASARAALVTIGGAGLGLGLAVKQAIDLEKRMALLAKSTDLDPEGLQSLRSEIDRMATSIVGVPIENLFEIATTGARLGVAAKNLPRYTEGIAKLSTAIDGVSADEIANQVGKINAVFDLGVDGAFQLGSAIDRLDDSSLAANRDILNVTQRTSGTAKALGLSAEEALAFSTALLNTGTRAEQASGSLTRLYQAVADRENFQGFANQLGITVDQFEALKRSDPRAAIQSFLEVLAPLDLTEQGDILDQVGIKGSEDQSEISKLASQIQNIATYTGYAIHEFKTLDQIAKSYNATAKTTGAQLDLARNNFRLTADAIGQALLPALGQLAGLFNTVTTDIRAGLEAQGPVIQRWQEEFSEALATVGAAYQNFGTLGERVQAEYDAYLNQLTDSFDAFAAYLATGWVDRIKDAFRLVGHEIGTFLSDTTDLFTDISNLGGDVLGRGPAPPRKFDPKAIGEGFEFQAKGFQLPGRRAEDIARIEAIDIKLGDAVAKAGEDAARAIEQAGQALLSPLRVGGLAEAVGQQALTDRFGDVTKPAGAGLAGLFDQAPGPKPAGEAFAGAGIEKKEKPTFGDIIGNDELTARFTKAASGALGGDKGDKQLAVAQEQKSILVKILTAVEKNGGRGGVARFGPAI